jgi:hypothetical protein
MDTVFRVLEIAIIPLIAAGLGAWALIRANRKEMRGFDTRNTQQHNENAMLLNHLSTQVGGIDSKVDRLDERLDLVQGWQFEHEKEHLTTRDRADI